MNVYPGMVLRVWSSGKGVYHYGIASTDGWVIDHAPRKGTSLRTWYEFSEGEPVEIVASEYGDYPPHIIHQRALSSIGRNIYSLFKLNCEHFVNWCKRGQAESKQLTKKTDDVVGTVLVTAGILLLGKLVFGSQDNNS